MADKIIVEKGCREEVISSHFIGEKNIRLRYLTVGELLREAARKFSGRIAVKSCHQNYALSFEEANEKVRKLAAGLIVLGLTKGDHVGIWSSDCVEWYISMLAAMTLGMVVVNLNPLYQRCELEKALKKADVKALIIGDVSNERDYYRMLCNMIPELNSYDYAVPLTLIQFPLLKMIISASELRLRGSYRWCDINFSNEIVPEAVEKLLQNIETGIRADDVCNLQFTSGTTGFMKAACLTHTNLVIGAFLFGNRLSLDKKHHTLCLQVPLFHIFGNLLGIICSLHFGTSVIIASPRFSARKSIEAIINENCSIIYGTPTMFIDLVNNLRENEEQTNVATTKITSLEVAVVGAAPTTNDLLDSIMARLNVNTVHTAYGMTEIGPVLMSKSSDHSSVLSTTTGYLLEYCEAKIIDEHDGIVPIGVTGECCFRGPSVMKCYYKDNDANSKSFLPGGWFRSGDKFIMLKGGYAKILGRFKDTILRGGENVEPSEIECVIATHPDVVDVQVFAVSDPRLHEEVAASIIKREASSLDGFKIREYCEDKLARYKIPKYVEFVQTYPKTASGKVMKFRLRENFETKQKINSGQLI